MVNRFYKKFTALFSQGVTPEELAVAFTLGIILGLFPMVGINTVLCFLAAFYLRLNFAAVQLGNIFITPVFLMMYIPFIRIGENIVGAKPLPLSVEKIMNMMNKDYFGAIQTIWFSNLLGIMVWLTVAIPLAYLLYRAMLPFFRRFEKTTANGSEMECHS